MAAVCLLDVSIHSSAFCYGSPVQGNADGIKDKVQ
jgi:hypothetical protein